MGYFDSGPSKEFKAELEKHRSGGFFGSYLPSLASGTMDAVVGNTEAALATVYNGVATGFNGEETAKRTADFLQSSGIRDKKTGLSKLSDVSDPNAYRAGAITGSIASLPASIAETFMTDPGKVGATFGTMAGIGLGLDTKYNDSVNSQIDMLTKQRSSLTPGAGPLAPGASLTGQSKKMADMIDEKIKRLREEQKKFNDNIKNATDPVKFASAAVNTALNILGTKAVTNVLSKGDDIAKLNGGLDILQKGNLFTSKIPGVVGDKLDDVARAFVSPTSFKSGAAAFGFSGALSGGLQSAADGGNAMDIVGGTALGGTMGAVLGGGAGWLGGKFKAANVPKGMQQIGDSAGDARFVNGMDAAIDSFDTRTPEVATQTNKMKSSLGRFAMDQNANIDDIAKATRAASNVDDVPVSQIVNGVEYDVVPAQSEVPTVTPGASKPQAQLGMDDLQRAATMDNPADAVPTAAAKLSDEEILSGFNDVRSKFKSDKDFYENFIVPESDKSTRSADLAMEIMGQVENDNIPLTEAINNSIIKDIPLSAGEKMTQTFDSMMDTVRNLEKSTNQPGLTKQIRGQMKGMSAEERVSYLGDALNKMRNDGTLAKDFINKQNGFTPSAPTAPKPADTGNIQLDANTNAVLDSFGPSTTPKPKRQSALAAAVDNIIAKDHPELFHSGDSTPALAEGGLDTIPRMHVEDLKRYFGDTADLPASVKRTTGKQNIDELAASAGFDDVDQFVEAVQNKLNARKIAKEDKKALAALRRDPEIKLQAQAAVDAEKMPGDDAVQTLIKPRIERAMTEHDAMVQAIEKSKPKSTTMAANVTDTTKWGKEWTKDTRYGNDLYHETSPENALAITSDRGIKNSQSIEVTNDISLAKGQGGNNITLVFDSTKAAKRLKNEDKMKPAAGFLHQQGKTDELYLTPDGADRGWIKGIIIKKGTPGLNKPGGPTKSLFKNAGINPDKSRTLPNGDTIFDSLNTFQMPISKADRLAAKSPQAKYMAAEVTPGQTQDLVANITLTDDQVAQAVAALQGQTTKKNAIDLKGLGATDEQLRATMGIDSMGNTLKARKVVNTIPEPEVVPKDKGTLAEQLLMDNKEIAKGSSKEMQQLADAIGVQAGDLAPMLTGEYRKSPTGFQKVVKGFFKDVDNVTNNMSRMAGKVGSDFADKMQTGAAWKVKYIDKTREIVDSVKEFTADKMGVSMAKAQVARIRDAIEADDLSKLTQADMPAYDATKRLFDITKDEMVAKGRPVRDKYFSHVELESDDNATGRILDAIFGGDADPKAAFTKQRKGDDAGNVADIHTLLSKYQQGMANDLAYYDAWKYMQTNLKNIPTYLANDAANMSSMREYVSDLFQHARHGSSETAASRIVGKPLDAFTDNVLRFNIHNTFKNFTDRIKTNSIIHPEAKKIKVDDSIIAKAEQFKNFTFGDSKAGITDSGDKLSQLGKGMDMISPNTATEKIGVNFNFKKGLAEGLYTSEVYQKAKASGMSEIAAQTKAMAEDAEQVLRTANYVAGTASAGNSMQQMATLRNGKPLFGIVPWKAISRFVSYPLTNVATVARNMVDPSAARAVQAYARGNMAGAKNADILGTSKTILDMMEKMAKDPGSKIPANVMAAKIDAVKKVVDSMDAIIGKDSNITRGNTAATFAKVWAATTVIQMAVTGAQDVVFQRKGSDAKQRDLVATALRQTPFLDVSRMVNPVLNPFLNTSYGTVSVNAGGALNLIPYAGSIDTATGGNMSKWLNQNVGKPVNKFLRTAQE